jgi:hypothetical protein
VAEGLRVTIVAPFSRVFSCQTEAGNRAEPASIACTVLRRASLPAMDDSNLKQSFFPAGIEIMGKQSFQIPGLSMQVSVSAMRKSLRRAGKAVVV